MKLEINKCYILAKKGSGEQLIYLLSTDFIRTVFGKYRLCLSYSEVYGCIETSIDYEDIDYIYQKEIDDKIKNRLIEKWGEDLAKERGIENER